LPDFFEGFDQILKAGINMLRNLITIKKNIVLPVAEAVTKTIDTLVNSELTKTVIETKVNLTKSVLKLGPKVAGTAVAIAKRKAAVFQLAVCKLFCPLTGGSKAGIEKCQRDQCKNVKDFKIGDSSEDRSDKSFDDDDDDEEEPFKKYNEYLDEEEEELDEIGDLLDQISSKIKDDDNDVARNKRKAVAKKEAAYDETNEKKVVANDDDDDVDGHRRDKRKVVLVIKDDKEAVALEKEHQPTSSVVVIKQLQ